MGYHRLTLGERYPIIALFSSGMSYRGISKQHNRSPSTISRELKRNTGRSGYRPKHATRRALERRGPIHPPFKIVGELRRKVMRHKLR